MPVWRLQDIANPPPSRDGDTLVSIERCAARELIYEREQQHADDIAERHQKESLNQTSASFKIVRHVFFIACRNPPLLSP